MKAGLVILLVRRQDQISTWQSSWQGRWQTMRAIYLLVKAQLCISLVPISKWHKSLGVILAGGTMQYGLAVADMARANQCARRMQRALDRLPMNLPCLAQAVALQWLLRSNAIPSRLVIARQKSAQDDTGKLDLAGGVRDSFHAWVEANGEMLIGHCEPADYRPLLIFGH